MTAGIEALCRASADLRHCILVRDVEHTLAACSAGSIGSFECRRLSLQKHECVVHPLTALGAHQFGALEESIVDAHFTCVQQRALSDLEL